MRAESTQPLSGRGARRANEQVAFEEATQDGLRSRIEAAVERAQRSRALAVQPAIIENVIRDGAVRVVFGIDSTRAGDALAGQLTAAQHDRSVEDLRVFPLLAHGAARLDADALLLLIESNAVPTIELDRVYRPSLLHTVPLVGADLAHGLDFDGDGMAVAVLDSGVENTHPFFADRIVEEACFSVLGQCPNGGSRMFGPGAAAPCAHSKCSHGTHVAGIAVGRDPESPLVGVAPNANLIAIQIFSEFDGDIGAYSSDILAAFQHLLGLAPFYRIASVNLSIGGDPFPSEWECDQASASQRAAIGLLRNVGILTVAASGNDRLTNATSSPSCLSNVIGVGATTASDRIAPFSNTAEFLSLLAPGQSIESANVGGGIRYGTGTSMAAPHVAGAVAVIREAFPVATVGEIENAMLLSGIPILDERNGETIPRLEIERAIGILGAAAPPAVDPETPPVDPSAEDPTSAVASAGGGGGGGACGLVGLEPFLMVGLIRAGRRRKRCVTPDAPTHATPPSE